MSWRFGVGWHFTLFILDGIIDSMDMSLSKLQEMVKDRGVRHDWAAEQHQQQYANKSEIKAA